MTKKEPTSRKAWKPGDPVGTGRVHFETEGDRQAYAEAIKHEQSKARYKRVHQPQRGHH